MVCLGLHLGEQLRNIWHCSGSPDLFPSCGDVTIVILDLTHQVLSSVSHSEKNWFQLSCCITDKETASVAFSLFICLRLREDLVTVLSQVLMTLMPVQISNNVCFAGHNYRWCKDHSLSTWTVFFVHTSLKRSIMSPVLHSLLQNLFEFSLMNISTVNL